MATLYFGDKSRLIIKNIPNSLDNSSLDKLITKKCKDLGVTKCDIKLLTKEKKINKAIKRISRGICYVGFISEKDATKFLKHYNNSYFNSCKVSIEYSKSPTVIENKPEIKKPKDTESKIIENGKVIIEKQVTPRKAGVSSKQVHIKFDSDSDEDFIDHTANGIDKEKDNNNNENKETKEEKTKENKNKQKENKNKENKRNEEKENKNHIDKHDLLDMNRVVIFNLPYTVTEEMIRNLVKPFGKVEQIHIPLSKHNFTDPLSVDSNATKGMCFVTFAFESDAMKFMEEKNKSIFSGRIISVCLANAQNPDQPQFFSRIDKYYNKRRNDGSFSEFKIKKRKEESTNADIWNILHIDIHSTIKAISSELEIESEEILKGEEAGVNLALSESYILSKLKNWFVDQGINYETTEYNEDNLHEDILLIKNLPYNSDDKELIKLFSNYGQIIRFTTSPFKLLGLIQFNNKFECDKAFRNLSYRMYRGLPLYLQRVSKTLLPSSVSISESKELIETINKENKNKEKETKEKKNKEEQEQNEIKEIEEENENKEEERVGHVSVYVSNIDPSVDEKDLEKEFSNLKGFIIVKIIRPIRNDKNIDKKNEKETQKENKNKRNEEKENDKSTDKSDETTSDKSMVGIERPRYGFIEFDSVKNAKEAIKKMCNTVIGGKILNLELSKNNQTISKHQRKKEDGPQEENDIIIVKNLPFQANKKELADLFKYYANVKTVRIPKSAGNNHRGFGFVEFMSKNDAKVAMENLKNVHLYGRRLVLQYVENTK